MSEEGLNKTDNEKIYVAAPIVFDEKAFYRQLNDLFGWRTTSNRTSVPLSWKLFQPIRVAKPIRKIEGKRAIFAHNPNGSKLF